MYGRSEDGQRLLSILRESCLESSGFIACALDLGYVPDNFYFCEYSGSVRGDPENERTAIA